MDLLSTPLPHQYRLPPDKVQMLRDALRDLHDATIATAKLSSCGIDCQERMRTIESLHEKLNGLIQQFHQPG